MSHNGHDPQRYVESRDLEAILRPLDGFDLAPPCVRCRGTRGTWTDRRRPICRRCGAPVLAPSRARRVGERVATT